MSVVITGASGHLGRLAARFALERLEPSELVLVTRSPQTLAEPVSRGVAVRQGDFDDPASLAAAFRGGQSLLLISSDAIGRRATQHRAAIAAAEAAGVQKLVYTSYSSPVKGNPLGIEADEHRLTEKALRASGLAWTILRNGTYAEAQVPAAAAAIASGRLVTNAGAGLVPYVSREDCAAAAAAAVMGEGHEHMTYEITGPELLRQEDVADLLGELSGRPVEVVHVDDDTYARCLMSRGLPERHARSLTLFGVAMREGYFEVLGTAVHDLTGRSPLSLRDVFTAHLEELLQAA